MAILMVRHGQTNWNVERRVQGSTDIELNETGIEQAKLVSKKLKEEKIDRIISSPLKRAKQTAQIIAKEVDCPIIYEEGLMEREFGDFEGLKATEFDYDGFNSYQANKKGHHVENIRDFRERIYQTLDKIIAKYPDQNILLVAHGGVSIPVYCYFKGLPNQDNLGEFALKNCEVAKYMDIRRKV